MAAALLLVPRMLFGLAADGFLVGYLRAGQRHFQIILALQPVGGDLQMDVALAGQQQLAGIRVMPGGQRQVFLHQLRERARQLHLVIAVGGVQRHGIDRGQRFRPGRVVGHPVGHMVTGGQRVAGGDRLHLAHCHHIAGTGFGYLREVRSQQMIEAANPRLAVRAGQHLPILHATAPDPGQRQLAGMGEMQRLEHLQQRFALRRDRLAPGGVGRVRDLVPQRLQQAVDAVILLRSTEKHRHDQVGLQILRQRAVDVVRLRHHVFQQLLQ